MKTKTMLIFALIFAGMATAAQPTATGPLPLLRDGLWTYESAAAKLRASMFSTCDITDDCWCSNADQACNMDCDTEWGCYCECMSRWSCPVETASRMRPAASHAKQKTK